MYVYIYIYTIGACFEPTQSIKKYVYTYMLNNNRVIVVQRASRDLLTPQPRLYSSYSLSTVASCPDCSRDLLTPQPRLYSSMCTCMHACVYVYARVPLVRAREL